MSQHRQLLDGLYDAFNRLEIETIISKMQLDVKWANGLDGGFVHGRDEVRQYWISQFENIRCELETLKFETDDDGREVVTTHQVIKDLERNVLADATIQQIFTIDDGLISVYEIGDAETTTERIEKAKTK